MSKRTAEASKAIRAAWLKEQKLVLEGKGTRDWTAVQQREILEFGKAYYHSDILNDVNDGKAFEGHHMKSAEKYPEYQGDPENIQFLSRLEHLEAHSGDYRNSTNGYYDPVTKITRNFGENKYEPCEIKYLSNPIRNVDDATHEHIKDKRVISKEDNVKMVRKSDLKNNSSQKNNSLKLKKRFDKTIINSIESIANFNKQHPILMGVLKVIGVVTVAVGTETIANKARTTDRDLRVSSSNNNSNSFSDDENIDYSCTDDYNDKPSDRDCPNVRSSPIMHIVSDHEQGYHTKNGIIRKKKKQYTRGGKNDNDRETTI